MDRRALLLAPIALWAHASAARAAPDTRLPFGQPFAALHERLQAICGACLELAHEDIATGNILQRTTTGLLVWRQADGVSSFTNGMDTWLAGPGGVQRRANGQRFGWEIAGGGGNALYGPSYVGLTGVQPTAQRHILSCEAASAALALRLVGHDVTEEDLLARLPMDPRPPVLKHGVVQRWGDPARAFVGRVDGWFPWAAGGKAKAGTHGWGYGVYAGPLLTAVRTIAPRAVGGSGIGRATLAAALQAGRPAVVWIPDRSLYLKQRKRSLQMGQWLSWDGTPVRFAYDEHAQVLLGMDRPHVLIGNVGYQASHSPFLSAWPIAEFDEAYAVLNQMAVLV